MRIYRESLLEPARGWPESVPVGYAQFADDYRPIRRLAPAVRKWTTYDAGGHFAARQAPGLLVRELMEFFGRLR